MTTLPSSTRVARLLLLIACAFSVLAVVAALGDTISTMAHLVGASWARLGPSGTGIFAGGLSAFVVLTGAGRLAARSRLTDRQLLLLGVVIVLAIRLAVVLLIDSPVPVDGSIYRKLALRIIDDGFVFSNRPTGYPYLLSLAYQALGRSFLSHELINVAFATVGGALLFDLARGIAGRSAAFIAMLAFAAMPGPLLLTPVRLVDPVFATVVIAICWAASRTSRNLMWAVVAGAFVGASQYIRPIGPVLLAAVAVALVLSAATWRRGAMSVGLLIASFLIVILPVFAHNLAAHGELSPSTSSYGGWSLYVGTNQISDGRWNQADADFVRTLTGKDFWQRSELAGQLGVRRITDDPIGFLGLAIRKFAIMWGTENYAVEYGLDNSLKEALPSGAEAGVYLLAQLSYLVLLVAVTTGLLGLWRSRSLGPALLIVLCIVLAEMALHLFVEVKPRYHAHIEPLLLLMAAPAIASWSSRVRWLQSSRSWLGKDRRGQGVGSRDG